jgi:ribosomal protein S18 acetylase RimI-like enzyme
MKVEHKNIIFDQWLAQILQRDVYKFVIDDELIEKTGDQAAREYRLLRELQSRPVFMYAKVSAIAPSAVKFLETLGFNLVDTNVVFEKPIASQQRFAGHCAVRFALPEDKNQVVALAEKSFVYSRFHLDKSIPEVIANTIKATWVGNFFAGKRGDQMVVALMGEASVNEVIVGFLQLLQRNNDLTIDLIAVAENQRRKGVAGDMIAYAESQYQDCSRILVGTQVANIPSVRLYEKLGFRLCASNYVFHYHNLPLGEK